MKLKGVLAALAAIALAQGALATTGAESFNAGSVAQTYTLDLTGDGSGVINGTTFLTSSSITGVFLDGISFTNLAEGLWSLGPIGYQGNTHVLSFSGTGTFGGVISWNDKAVAELGTPVAMVPEPSTWVLMAVGLLWLAWRQRRSAPRQFLAAAF